MFFPKFVGARPSDGHMVDWKPLICDDDNQAIEKAREAFEHRTVELWCGERLVARLNAED
jgi:hypothetical protein